MGSVRVHSITTTPRRRAKAGKGGNMKYLLKIDDERLWLEAKVKAAREQTTLRAVLIAALERWVNEKRPDQRRA